MPAKSLAVSIEFAIPICLVLLIKPIAMYVESSDEFFIRNTVYFGFENLFYVPPAWKLVFPLQLRVTECCVFRYRGI